MSKRLYIGSGIVAIIVIAGVLWGKGNSNQEVAVVSPTVLSTPTATPSPTPTIKRSPKPTPGIIVKEVPNYASMVALLDPYNRYFAVDKDCTSIVPSQVEYPNDVQIMLDNKDSDKARILKIGGRQYSLEAHGWIITTLHSDTLPARLPIYCGDMELGAIDLVGK